MRFLGYITWQVFDVEGRNDLRDWDQIRSSHAGSQSPCTNDLEEI